MQNNRVERDSANPLAFAPEGKRTLPLSWEAAEQSQRNWPRGCITRKRVPQTYSLWSFVGTVRIGGWVFSFHYLVLTLGKGSSCLLCCRAAWWQCTGTDGRASVSFFAFRQCPSLLLPLTASLSEFSSWYKDTKPFLFTPGNNHPCSLRSKKKKEGKI